MIEVSWLGSVRTMTFPLTITSTFVPLGPTVIVSALSSSAKGDEEIAGVAETMN